MLVVCLSLSALKICFRFVSDSFQICFRFFSDLFQICFRFVSDLFHFSSRYKLTSLLFKERPKGHFWLSDNLKYVELLFVKLKTTAKMMCPKGSLMLILNVFVFFLVISSQSTAGKRHFMCYPLHKFYMLTRHPLNCIKNMLGRKTN